jgi:hypothetical protein
MERKTSLKPLLLLKGVFIIIYGIVKTRIIIYKKCSHAHSVIAGSSTVYGNGREELAFAMETEYFR